LSENESNKDSVDADKLPIETRLVGNSLLLANSIASFFPGVSGLTSELIGRLRERRIRHFVEMLASRITNIEQRQEVFTQPACIELLEEAAEQAARGENDLKRTTLARLLAASINDDLVNHETDRLLLAILHEMTDYELLHLINHFANSRWVIDDTYSDILNNSDAVLNLRRSHMGSTQEESDLHQVQQAHHLRLERLGLLINEGTSDRPRRNSTPLGRLLLQRTVAIARADE
jgi:hypothetical protein